MRSTAVPAAPAVEQSTRSRFAGTKLARQIAILGLVLCVIALSLAYPLRNYLDQRAALSAAVIQQHVLEQRIAELQIQQAALSDPTYIAAEAKRRLQYVKPGDTVYVVQAPDLPTGAGSADATPAPSGPWYSVLWGTLANDSGPAVDPSVLNAPVPDPPSVVSSGLPDLPTESSGAATSAPSSAPTS